MILHLYENHLGGLFWSDEEYEYEDLYCDSCGDSDRWIGQAETYIEAIALLSEQKDYIDSHIAELASEAFQHFTGREEQ